MLIYLTNYSDSVFSMSTLQTVGSFDFIGIVGFLSDLPKGQAVLTHVSTDIVLIFYVKKLCLKLKVRGCFKNEKFTLVTVGDFLHLGLRSIVFKLWFVI